MKFNACLNDELVKMIRQVKELHEFCNSEKERNDALFALQEACTTEKYRKRQYNDATKVT